MEYFLHEIITSILSCFLSSVNKDLQIQKNILMQFEIDDNNLDLYKNIKTKTYDNFINDITNKSHLKRYN